MADVAEIDDLEPLDPTLQNIVDQESLKWIFVGGKGGVGKTTTSSSLAVMLAAARRSVLIVSTDPAHNLSDAFGQKFSKVPTPVNGIPNLFAMEVDPVVELEDADVVDSQDMSLISELSSAIPGIDEAMSFGELMRHVQSLEYDCIVFDTAPTGHTLRLLSFPAVLDKGLAKVFQMRSRFASLFETLKGAIPQLAEASEDALIAKLESLKEVVDTVNAQFKDPDITTFICVCIPEFLSLYETERLVQELNKQSMDCHCVVVNQVLFPPPGSTCELCTARVKMQHKYLNQIDDLYEDFHVVRLPLLPAEVRGVPALQQVAQHLRVPYSPS
mmetsp:Transcript_74399/g.174613  ORF Transcript_74399/g.174613 Transcript_74399/m.174613 type:complete len:329 (-) Transcript_74399:52-1038(-)